MFSEAKSDRFDFNTYTYVRINNYVVFRYKNACNLKITTRRAFAFDYGFVAIDSIKPITNS